MWFLFSEIGSSSAPCSTISLVIYKIVGWVLPSFVGNSPTNNFKYNHNPSSTISHVFVICLIISQNILDALVAVVLTLPS